MAGNARFHDKFHRKNHHTNATVGFADSATDPIASPSEPFQGDFVVNGKLSASSGIQILSAVIEHDLYCENIHVTDVTYTNYISGNSTEVIISDGSLDGNGNNTLTLDFQSGIFARTPKFNITGDVSSSSALFIDSNATIKNSLFLSGNATINGNTSVSGNSIINGNVGVGVISAVTKLHVNGDITVPVDKFINFALNSNGHTAIKRNGASNGLEFYTNSNPRVFITDSGNVGIGTDTPNENLTVNGKISTNNYLYSQDITINRGDTDKEGGQINFNRSSDNITSWAIDVYSDTIGDTDSRLRFVNVPANQELVTILSSGNLGIGTQNPTQKLHVEGDIYANGNIRTTGDLYVQGNLSALGDISIINTDIISTSSLSVINYGATQALLINQITNFPIAKFQKNGNDTLIINENQVTIYNTLTAKDYISSPNINLLQSTSSNWDTTYNTVCSTSSQWMTGGDKDFKVKDLNVTNILTVSGLKVTRSLYNAISTLTATGDINLEIDSPTYLFIDTNGLNLTLTLPDTRPEHIGLTFFIKNNYGGATLVSQITAKNYGGSTEVILDKKGVVPSQIELIWDGLLWQQISLA